MVSNVANWAQILSVFVIPVAVYGYRKLNGQMHNNGGSTLKDAIDRIELDGKATRKMVKKLDKKYDALDAKLDSHLADFEE